jgi:hypothetical protein
MRGLWPGTVQEGMMELDLHEALRKKNINIFTQETILAAAVDLYSRRSVEGNVSPG